MPSTDPLSLRSPARAGRVSRRAGRPPCPAFLAFQSGAKLPPSSAAARARAAPAQKRGQPLQGSPLNEAHPADYLGEAEIILVPYLAARSMGLNGVPALSLGAGGFAPHAITGRLGAPFLPCLRSAAAALRQCPNYLMAPPKARRLNGAAIGQIKPARLNRPCGLIRHSPAAHKQMPAQGGHNRAAARQNGSRVGEPVACNLRCIFDRCSISI